MIQTSIDETNMETNLLLSGKQPWADPECGSRDLRDPLPSCRVLDLVLGRVVSRSPPSTASLAGGQALGRDRSRLVGHLNAKV